MAVAVINKDAVIESIETGNSYRNYFDINNTGRNDESLFDPMVYKERFYANDFLKYVIAIKKCLMYQKPVSLCVRVLCNLCQGDSENSLCFRTCRFLPYKDDKVILYTSVKPDTCEVFEEIVKQA